MWKRSLLAVVVLLAAACSGDGAADDTRSAPTTGHTHANAPSPEPLRPGERFLTLEMPEPYSPAAPSGGTDDYRCFLVDPKLTAETFLTGSQFMPENTDLVHHAIFFRLKPADLSKAHKADAATPGVGWTCFGNAGIDAAGWVASWAPGANEKLLDPTLGFPLPPGTQLVMQVHYNLLGVDGAAPSDQSSIRLRLNDDVSGMKRLGARLVAAPVELPCTAAESGPLCDRKAAVADVTKRFGPKAPRRVAGLNQLCRSGKPPVAGATQQCDFRAKKNATVYAAAGHMHLLGRSIKIELNPGTPTAKTLLDVPAYDFDDQSIRPLATPVQVKAGDTYRVTCTHDASLRGQLPQLKGQPARYVVWGEGTSDEMCLGMVLQVPTT
ncbi:Copper type II ascorbate-dependent monooxygenase, C-terminal domain [Cryptosporangium aurantiacum]|uniref:Copper type II ascorbate-dependent monooxygenase, C-terminal domain n=2 Tax=Cryptosporangium aurantiacum TaxID=134849 RepID=A0A1M7Q4Y0_9ACTN|nr:Copper type II ascorbate-dependent monooxygenase, C-terminal domain [Cryptosporangium aurantiacum]